MYCGNCGNQLNEQERFCPVCGARVPESDGSVLDTGNVDNGADVGNTGGQPFSGLDVRNQYSEEQQETGNLEKRSGSRAKMIALITAVVLLAAAAIAVVFLLVWPLVQGKQSDEENQGEMEKGLSEILPEDENTDEPEVSDGKTDASDEVEKADEKPEFADDDNTAVSEPQGTPTGLSCNGREVYMADFDISASSVLVLQGYNYEEKNLTDLDTSTCWSEGAAGNGTNETLHYTSLEKQTVSGLAVLPGYTKSKDLYDKNCAPSMIRIECGGRVFNYSFSRGDVSFGSGNMLDNMIYIDFGETFQIDECMVTITDVSSGSVEDCCISEMFLYN